MMGEAQRSLCCIDRQMTSTERSEKTSTESANLPRIGVPHISLVFREMWDTTTLDVYAHSEEFAIEAE
jgi:hypothetical protein